jgi:2-hydroxychromene-2-carboxylate isomerase
VVARDGFRQETDAAMERGVFGAPYVIVDGEPFWGNDRLTELDRRLVGRGRRHVGTEKRA